MSLLEEFYWIGKNGTGKSSKEREEITRPHVTCPSQNIKFINKN